MVYKPSKEEIKQLKNLNKAYNMLTKSFELIIKNVPGNDAEIAIYAYRVSKNMNSIIKRTAELLKVQHVNNEFNDIVKQLKDKKKGK